MSDDHNHGVRGLSGVVDALAFACEIALLATLSVAGTGLGQSRALHVAGAIVLPLLAAGIWSVWMAPMSTRRLADPARFIAQCAIFVVAGVLAALAGRALWGLALVVLSVAVFAATRATVDGGADPADR